jgi:2-hydroxy-6-oxonona-2,4-dienedioate hydrolase
VAFSAGRTSAVQLALRHPSRVTRLVLVAANAPHPKPVTLAPRRLAPVMFSQPVLWALRVFMPTRLARIAGAPADYPLTGADRHTLAAIFDSFFPVAPRRPGAIFDGYVGNPEIATYPLEEVSAPTLGVHALDDPLAPYEDARAMVARIPNSRWVGVERGGHIFIHDDRRAVAEITRVLASERDPGGDGEVDRDRQEVLDHRRQRA